MCSMMTFSLSPTNVYVKRCVDYGVLSHEEAARLYKVITKRKGKGGGGSSSASSPAPAAKKKKMKVKVVRDDAVDVGMQTSGADAVGQTVL